jgi:hypothetical protein
MTSSGGPEQTPAPDAPRSPGGAEAEQPADQATGAASTADTVSASDAERSSGGRQAEQPADRATDTRPTADAAPAPDAAQSPDAPNADQDQVDDPAQTVTSPRLEHLQQTIDGAQQAADQALGPQRT